MESSYSVVRIIFFIIWTSITQIKASELGCIETCQQQSQLVCATNGRTYQNLCFLRNAACRSKEKIGIAYFGICEGLFRIFPDGNFEPVCGSDGITYSNIAFLRLGRCFTNRPVKKIFNGPCECRGSRACGYGTLCAVRIVNGSPVCQPKCENERRQLFWGKRRRTYLVCASDGKTYTLERFNYLRCKSDGRLTKVHYGRCKKQTCLIRNCPKIFAAVCGSDLRTYPNECTFQNELCLQKGRNTRLRIINRGPCQFGTPDVIIGSKYNPVCGSDGSKYYNIVALQTQQCVKDVKQVDCIKSINVKH